jgi:recombinational DNA repair protein RecR
MQMRKWNKCRKCGCFLDPGEGSICDDCRRAQEKVKIVPTIQEHGGQYRLFLKPDKKE